VSELLAGRTGARTRARTPAPASTERADVVIAGARCAGSAAAIALARAGARVVALDRARFPSDTLSTHLLWPGGLAELRALGALERVEAIGAPRLPVGFGGGGGHVVRGRFTPVDGIDYAMCVRRPGLDAALVATARAAGAEIRERAGVTGLIADGGRVRGVVYEDADGARHEVHAPLVIGADGRRSTVARLVGADAPHRSRRSGRACFFAYWRDAPDVAPHWRATAAQWREGPELGTAFPCDGDLVLILVQPPVRRADDFRGDLTSAYERTVRSIPGLAGRLAGAERVTKVRAARDLSSYFRRSVGAGWALAGDAGHFKDPVTAQGIRDALRYGRLLGATAARAGGDLRALDAGLARWERDRERDCLEVYQWTDVLARGEAMSPIEVELYRRAERDGALATELLDVFSRVRRPSRFLSPARAAALAVAALRRGDAAARRATLAPARRERRAAATDARERVAARLARS
jgi:flavin-dependent dehydrogenase